MSLAYNLHAMIPLMIVIMPLLPVYILKKIFFLPLILPLIWIIFGDCPINKLHKNKTKNDGFIKSLLINIWPKINTKMINNIITFVLSLSITLSAIKIMFYYKIYRLR